MSSLICLCVVLIWLFSGCCPYSKKKKVDKAIQPSEKPVSVQELPTVKPKSEQKVSTDPGAATPTDIKIATTDGELPPAKPEDATKFVKPGEDIKEIFQPIYFDFDRYNIKTSEQPKLKALAEYLKKNPEISILIEGHCDERGTDEYNLVLGEKRALSTRNFLVGLGIAPKRLYTISYGESKPADPGHNEEAWAKNRRAEFKIKQ